MFELYYLIYNDADESGNTIKLPSNVNEFPEGTIVSEIKSSATLLLKFL